MIQEFTFRPNVQCKKMFDLAAGIDAYTGENLYQLLKGVFGYERMEKIGHFAHALSGWPPKTEMVFSRSAKDVLKASGDLAAAKKAEPDASISLGSVSFTHR